MALRVTFRRDVAGIGAVLKSKPVQVMIEAAAKQVAANVDSQKLEATSGTSEGQPPQIKGTVHTSVTDRARANVVIEHPAGQGMQAKHGVLTRAAAEAGLEVTEK